MKKNLLISIWFTLATTVLFGIIYPLVVTGIAQVIFPKQANGEPDPAERETRRLAPDRPAVHRARILLVAAVGGRLAGYDPTASSGSNLGPTNKALQDRVAASVQQLQPTNPGAPIPVDLVTTSGSGLDPDISPAAAEFQIPRVAKERGMSEQEVRAAVARHTKGRQFGFLGEARVNVLDLNLDLDAAHPMH